MLPCRAAASKVRSALSGGRDSAAATRTSAGGCMSFHHDAMAKIRSLSPAGFDIQVP
jgi:hypothetical protein